jgi:RNA polymerase I-specific transcription initiation factor RRN3
MQDKDGALERTRRELNQAIEEHAYGRDNARYNHIKSIFTTSTTAADAPSPSALRDHVIALTYSVSRLNRSCSGLVHAVLSCNWLGRDEAFVALFTNFLGNLVTAQGIYVGAVLSMLVENLCSGRANFGGIKGSRRKESALI